MTKCDCGFKMYEDSFYGTDNDSRVWCSLAYNLGFNKPHKKCKPATCPIWQTYSLLRDKS